MPRLSSETYALPCLLAAAGIAVSCATAVDNVGDVTGSGGDVGNGTQSNSGNGGMGVGASGVGGSATSAAGGASTTTTGEGGSVTSVTTATTGAGGMSSTTATSSSTTATSSSTTATSSSTTATTSSTTATSTTSTTATSTTATSTSSTTSATTVTTSSSVSSSTGGCVPVNLLLDSGFEGGPMGGSWTESSSNFGTPICDAAGCGTGSGTGPAAGTYWAWFGGVDLLTPIIPEIGILSQTVTIPIGTATLTFQLEMPVCDTFFDTFEAKVDNQTVFLVDGGDAACGVLGYQQHMVDVSAFADGLSHTLELRGINESVLFGTTNFMVDNVELIGCL